MTGKFIKEYGKLQDYGTRYKSVTSDIFCSVVLWATLLLVCVFGKVEVLSVIIGEEESENSLLMLPFILGAKEMRLEPGWLTWLLKHTHTHSHTHTYFTYNIDTETYTTDIMSGIVLTVLRNRFKSVLYEFKFSSSCSVQGNAVFQAEVTHHPKAYCWSTRYWFPVYLNSW